MAALHSSLGAVRGLDIQRIDPRNGALLGCVRVNTPDFIIFELACMTDQTAFTLVKEFPQVDLIGLDPETHRVLILSVMKGTSPNTDDLVRLIQEKGMAAQQG
jgi:hypothetical protein